MSLINLNLSLNTDRTVNRIAVCSAVIAGFAYVGYSVCRNALSGKRSSRRKEEESSHSIILRRLSQTTQTDALLGDLVLDGSQRILLRPKSVQERIKELNMQARQFASAVSAIQRNSIPRYKGGRSLQATPWSSPRILSPVDINPVALDQADHSRDSHISPYGSPSKQKMFKSVHHRNDHKVDLLFQDERVIDIDELWIHNRREVLGSLPMLLSGSSTNLSMDEAKILIAALNCKDPPLQQELARSLANYATFQCNQDLFCKAGLNVYLPQIYVSSSDHLKKELCILIGNMALHEQSSQDLYPTVTMLSRDMQNEPVDSSLLTNQLKALVNIAVLPTWHTEMKILLHQLYSLLDEGLWDCSGNSLQSLRLLINLSCNPDMIPSLLAAQAPRKLIYLFDVSTPSDVLLRIVTFLANLAESTKRLKIDVLNLPAEGKAAAPDTMYAAIFGLAMVERYKRKAMHLSERHADPDVCDQAKRLWKALSD